jgi:hypothetical protein
MRTCLGVVLLLAVTPAAVGAEDREAGIKEAIGLLKEALPILKTVTDKASAEAALPKLKALDDRITALEKKEAALPKATEEERKRLEAKYKEPLEKVLTDLGQEFERIGKIPAASAVLKDVFPLKQLHAGKGLVAQYEQVKISVARIEVRALEQQLQVYKLSNGDYPQNLEALAQPQPSGGAALVPKEKLLDPWKRPYQYNPAGPKNQGLKPDVWSLGPNPKNADGVIGNWQKP